MKRKFAPLLLFALFFCSGIVPAQNHYLDSLQQHIASGTNDSVKVEDYFKLGQAFTSDPAKAVEVASKMMDFSIVIKDKSIKALCLRKTGNIYYRHLYYEKAVNCYMRSMALYEQLNNKTGIANCLNNLGNVYTSKGKLTNSRPDFEQAIDYHNKALQLRIEMKDTGNICNSYNNIGNAYSGKGDLEKALEYYTLAFKDYKAHNDPNGIDIVTMNLGETHLGLAEKTGKTEEFGKALEYFLDRVRAYKGNGPTANYASVLSRIGRIYMIQGDMTQALKYLSEGYTMAMQVNAREQQMDIEGLLAEAYGKTGDYKKAFECFRRYNALKDSVINEKTAGNLAQMQAMYETAQKDKAIDLLNKDKEIDKLKLNNQEADLDHQKYVIAASVGALIFVFGIALLLYNRNNIRKRANKELSEAYKKVELANRQVTDSINYAKRIQDAILVPEAQVRNYLTDFFVFFRPRDIVSGDFYWFSFHKEKIFFAVADCTGHGVPGAFMSMIGNTLLNEIVNHKNILEPGRILEHLNDGVIAALRQNKNDLLSQDDGMDISVCCMDKKAGKLFFAGANHNIFLVKGGTVKTLQGDIHSIGGSLGSEKREFRTGSAEIAAGTFVFMSSDGFYDQFGGPDGSKFLTTRFEKLIVEAAASSQPRTILEKAFIGWKGENKQIDDVLVAGFKMS
jgi:serine phosphatase RsbU (regulator of sigma subunit)